MEPDFSANALAVLRRRYLQRNRDGDVIETPARLLRRVAGAVSRAERTFGNRDASSVAEEFYEMMASLRFLPNSPTIMNAGLPRGQLSACFVIPIEDSLQSIFKALSEMAMVHQSGGGTGFSFSALRPVGDVVRSTGGVASGPVSFMRIFDVATEIIKQGGRRRGANMGILSASHPDIEEFISIKRDGTEFQNFNLSVAVSDHFKKAVDDDGIWELVNPRTSENVRGLSARELWMKLAGTAWASGDPGVVFMDRMNAANPTPFLGRFDATNPCGEQPLLPHESCTLGSLRLSSYTSAGDVDWDLLSSDVELSIRFLDDVIEVNRFPVKAISDATRLTRKVGLGVMGFADALVDLEIPYASDEALKLADDFMSRISADARSASRSLAEERGVFRAHDLGKVFNCREQRNATVTTIAPTGTISILAGCSGGIEPIFALAYRRLALDGQELPEINQRFIEHARRNGYYSKDLMERVARLGSVEMEADVPAAARSLLRSAHDIDAVWHVRMQAAFQRHVDNAVSKTVNMAGTVGAENVRDVFDMAFELGCKGITVYRDGSRGEQVLQPGCGCPLPECD